MTRRRSMPRLRHPPPSAALLDGVEAGALEPTDVSMLDVIARLFPEVWAADVAPWLCAAIAAPRAGHVGVWLSSPPWRSAPTGVEARLAGLSCVTVVEPQVLKRPIGTPFALQRQGHGAGDALLMCQRMWRSQANLIDGIAALSAGAVAPIDGLEEHLSRLYGDGESEAKAAARMVATRRFSVITGGPGTGKSWGVKRVLALLLSDADRKGETPRIMLCAPTGKAAVRLKEAIAEDLEELVELGVPAVAITQLKSLEPTTLHRTLGVRQGFKFGAHAPLPAEVVVVDEASMIDLELMRHLVEAVAAGEGRLVLLGDPDQLASVGAGSVLSDLISAQRQSSDLLTGHVASLTKSYRFAAAASIATVAAALQGDDDDGLPLAVSLLCGQNSDDPLWRRLCAADVKERDGVPRRLTWVDANSSRLTAEHLDALATGYVAPQGDGAAGDEATPGALWQLKRAIAAGRSLSDPQVQYAALKALSDYRVLCAHRRGPRGVEGVNEALTARAKALLPEARRSTWAGHWLGRPIMITQNAAHLSLRNGDVGMVLPDEAGLSALFLRPEGIQRVSLATLPAHQTAFAMSVHKSQGSQFRHVALVLPAAAGSPVCTRELVYTAITRATAHISWFGGRAVLEDALGRRVQRSSGLVELLTT